MPDSTAVPPMDKIAAGSVPGASGPIAIVAHTHPSVSKGGADIAAYALYEGLRLAGADAIFIAVCSSSARCPPPIPRWPSAGACC